MTFRTTQIPCPACPDGNEWDSSGPTGRACWVCHGTAVLYSDEKEDAAPDEPNVVNMNGKQP